MANPEPALDTRDAEVPINVAVEAGDLIGQTSGTEPAHTWDFIVVNRSLTNRFANQERYEQVSELVSLLHADCPFDYFEEPLRSHYRSLIGSWQGNTPGFGCNLEPDVPGTIADPTTVTSEHCFEDFNRPARHVYVELISDSELAAAFGDGAWPAELPATHGIFHR